MRKCRNALFSMPAAQNIHRMIGTVHLIMEKLNKNMQFSQSFRTLSHITDDILFH